MSIFKKSLLLSLLFLMSFQNYASEPLNIVVSIKPIYALVNGITEGVSKPTLILTGGESPHTYHLRPSDMKSLHQADVMIWIGPKVESFLVKPIQNINAQIITLSETPNLTLLTARRGGIWEKHHHGNNTMHHDEHEHHDEHNTSHTGDYNQHIWLDPINAKIMVKHIAHILSQLDTDNAQHYQANAARLNEKLEHLHQTLTTKLASVTTQPFLVFHDAYHYFEKRYNLHAVGSIAISPESQPSAKRILELRQRIQAQQVACVFGESQFASPILNTLLANTTAKSGQLDPIGATLPATTASYFTLLHNLSDAFLHCLQSKD